MPIVLAIEPDRRQAAHVSAVVRHRVGAELILADTTEGALDAIGNRVPDLVLVPALLSPQDDAALAAALRVIAAAAHVRTLTIPVFANTASHSEGGGFLSRLRRGRSESTSVGCDPAVFAEQINEYLREAAAERADREAAAASAPAAAVSAPVDEAAAHASPFIESSFVESPVVEAQPIGAPVLEPLSAVAPVLDTSIPDAPVVEAPIEPVRLIAPAIVTRAKLAQADTPPHATAFEASLAASPEEPVYVPAPALEFAEAAAAEFGDRAFVDARAQLEQPHAEDQAPKDPFDEAGDNEVVIDLSEDIVEISPEHAKDTREDDLFDGEPFGVYTLSVDESLEGPAEAVARLARTDAGSGDPALDSFKDFLASPSSATDTAAALSAVSKPVDETAWLTLGLRHTRQWPVMEGAIVESNPIFAELAAAVSARATASTGKHVEPAKTGAPTAATAASAPAPAHSARADHLDWSDLVASLRQDIERRRKHPAPAATVTHITARQAEPPPHPRPHLHAVENTAGRRSHKTTPVQDEWGFFDPQQCGFAALLAKLDEFSEAADEPEVRKTS